MIETIIEIFPSKNEKGSSFAKGVLSCPFLSLLMGVLIPYHGQADLLPYQGSSFSEVREVIRESEINEKDFTNKADFDRARWEVDTYKRGELPQYEVSLGSLFRYGYNKLEQDAKRTISEQADYYPRIEKLVHSNGICFTGEWKIDEEETGYTGYFAGGSHGLFIGRASAALGSTKAHERRGFGFAGKIFPTYDEGKVVPTANFFTVDVVPGEVRPYFSDTSLTNEPRANPGLKDFLNFPFVKMLLTIKSSLSKADENPGFRPLYPVALAGYQKDPRSARWPHWIKLNFLSQHRNNNNDFRTELTLQSGESHVLAIMISETTSDAGQVNQWKQIGTIQLKESFVTYGCDRRLHFAHPKLKASFQ